MSLYLPKKIQELPICLLHLPKRVCSSLQKAGVTTIGQLSDLGDSSLSDISGIGPKSEQSIKRAQQSLAASLDEDGLDWFQLWENLGIQVIPEGVDTTTPDQEILAELPLIIKRVLEQVPDHRFWNIIQRRFGLMGASVLTLEELGVAFGLTRERVRQLEVRALDELRDALIDEEYTGKEYRVHPRVVETIRSLGQIASDEAKRVLRESELFRRIQERYEVVPSSVKPSLFLVLELAGIRRLSLDREGLESVWGILSLKDARKVKWGVEKLDALLTEDFASPMDPIDILVHLNKEASRNRRFSLDELEWLVRICSSVEEYSPGFYWGEFARLTGRPNQVERILIESGEPVHINDITREINYRLARAERRTVDPRNLVNQMSGDERFVPIGRSGEWGLSSWSFNTENILELMKRCLMVRNEPATIDEIYAYVSERRPVRRSSIESYLTFLDDFARVDRDRWGLGTWSETKNARTWNPEQVAIFVEQIFKRNNSRKIEYGILKQALIAEAQVSPKQAQGMLNVNPVVDTERDNETGVLYAVFQPDYRERLENRGARLGTKQKTLMERIAEDTREILENAPGQQVALSELAEFFQEKYHCAKRTVYSYTSQLDFVEKFRMPNTHQKMCRLVVSDGDERSSLDQVDDIASSDLREKVARALSFLNINDVDIALFLLSKEFEAALRRYLELAYARGHLHYLPSGTLSLNVMIDFVEKEGIITDKAVLHFLRQKRNDRAHGTMPKLEERRLMMKHADVTAGMYIDYIKFFDDLSHQLV
jgi:hypothetical protein